MPSRPERAPIEFPAEAETLEAPRSFLDACAEFGIELTPEEIERLGALLGYLLRCNGLLNLTAVTEPEEAWSRHIFDSLTLLAVCSELAEGATVADVGSGGGLPGIPLAIVRPDLRFTLVESTAKKAEFLRAAAAVLDLENVEVVCDRAETVGQDHRAHREAYDLVTARALGRVVVAAELTVPLAKVGGHVVLTKGQKAEEELAEAKQALHRLHVVHRATLETPTGRLVVLEKPRKTPRDYPRRPGEPKRSPLR